ncbi:MAG TPA: gamma-glutamyl-gamma-aminobutyrate hydrolase family protein [Longimicrobiales bacterium]
MTPLIGVPTQTLQAIDGIPSELPHSWVMNHRYFTALTYVGAAPVMVPLLAQDETTLRAIYERLDGVFLAGGVDVDPASYQEDKLDVCGRTDPDRDEVELTLTRWAVEDGKPVLGVCRGMQVINVACGGSLLQDVAHASPRFLKHDYFPTQGFARDHLAHEAMVSPGSYLQRVYGGGPIEVNSMHHQGIAKLGDGLAATIHAPDDLIEGIEGIGENFLVGVQWHPEMLIERDAGTRRLFEEFRDAAAAFALSKV